MFSSKIYIPLLVASLFLALPACKKTTTPGNLNIELKGKYGAQSFVLNVANTDSAGRRVQIEKLKFYLSHITLVKTDNTEIEVSEVALFDFDNPLSLTLNVQVDDADFKAIKFGCGIDSVQNNTDPLSVPSDDPLSNDKGMAWPMLKYRFVSMEGKTDTAAGQSGLLTNALIYHVGTDAFYRQTTLSQNFSVCCGQTSTLSLYLDVAKIFYGDLHTLDIITEGYTQSESSAHEQAVATEFSDNFSRAFAF